MRVLKSMRRLCTRLLCIGFIACGLNGCYQMGYATGSMMKLAGRGTGTAVRVAPSMAMAAVYG